MAGKSDRTEYGDTLSVSQSDGEQKSPVMQPGRRSQAPTAKQKILYQEDGDKMEDYKNGSGLICLMCICGILAIVIAIIAFIG